MDELTDRHRDILGFARKWWLTGADRQEAIRDRFGVSPTRFSRELAAILDLPAAMSYDPLLVKRLHRQAGTQASVARHPAGKRLG